MRYLVALILLPLMVTVVAATENVPEGLYPDPGRWPWDEIQANDTLNSLRFVRYKGRIDFIDEEAGVIQFTRIDPNGTERPIQHPIEHLSKVYRKRSRVDIINHNFPLSYKIIASLVGKM